MPTGVTAPRQESSLFSDAALNILGAVGGVGLAGIASLVITRDLGVSNRGRWAVIAALASLVGTFASFGLQATLGYGEARLRSTARLRFVQAALIATIALTAFAGGIFLIVALIVKPPAPTLTVVMALALPMGTVAFAVTHFLVLTAAPVRWFAAAQLLISAVTLGGVLIVSAATTLTVLGIVMISAASQLVGVTINVVGVKRHSGFGTSLLVRTPVAAARELRPYVGYAAITFVTLSLTQIVQRVDILLVNGYRGSHAAGLYAVAAQVIDLMLVVPGAVGFVVFRRSARGSQGHWLDMTRALVATLAFGIGAAAVLASVSGWLVPVLFGHAYRGSVGPLRWLLPGGVAFAFQSVISQYLAGAGRPKMVMMAWLLGATIGVGADLFVIPAYGITGAAIVSSASYIVVTGLHVQALRALRPGNGEASAPFPAE